MGKPGNSWIWKTIPFAGTRFTTESTFDFREIAINPSSEHAQIAAIDRHTEANCGRMRRRRWDEGNRDHRKKILVIVMPP
jgi:hypothetical protein